MAGLRKVKALDIQWSNIANLGSDLEKNIRQAAAGKEEAWKTAGKKDGLEIWRIEKFRVVPWPREEYGKFYEGDSYIVLRTRKIGNAFKYDVHFWLGMETTEDESGTAAYKTVELDDYFGTAPVQHREVQGFESDLFLSYFPNNAITILAGGIESGFRHVRPEEYRPRLLQLKGKLKNVRVTEVPLKASSLNSGDVFILDKGMDLYQMNGRKSGGGERIKAGQLCRAIDDERKGLPKVHVAEEGDGDKDFWSVFWAALGGEGPIKSAEEGGDDAHATAEASKIRKLLRLSDAGGQMKLSLVAEGKFDKKMLDTSDVFILDVGHEVFAWVGLGASAGERKWAMKYAQQYLTEYKRPLALPISRIMEGGENEVFETAFKVF